MAIGNYIDALYFTVAMLTTTGFGDITLPGTAGRLLSILMMIVGVSFVCADGAGAIPAHASAPEVLLLRAFRVRERRSPLQALWDTAHLRTDGGS